MDQETGIKDPNQEPWKTLRRYSSVFSLVLYLFGNSYRRKPDTFGVDALFGINLAPTDDKNKILGIIRVGEQIRVIKDDPHFWEKSNLDH